MGRDVATYEDNAIVDPMWAIETAQGAGLDVEEFLDEYNLKLPTQEGIE